MASGQNVVGRMKGGLVAAQGTLIASLIGEFCFSPRCWVKLTALLLCFIPQLKLQVLYV